MIVSIIIPTFQMGNLISRAIRSALNQNFSRDKYEIIVVDDGSTDNTQAVLRNFSKKIKVVRNEINRGLSAARNSGLQMAQGRFVVNLDADDYIHPDLLSTESLFLSMNNSMDAVSCDYFIVDDKERHLRRMDGEKNPIACGIMFRKEQLVCIGLYDEDFFAREEEELRARFLKKYHIYNIPLPLYRYHRHRNNLTNNSALMETHKKKIRTKYDI